MSSVTLLSNLMLTLVLMISGIILLFIKTMPHSYNRSYRKAKRYVVYMWWLSGISIITTSPTLIMRTVILVTTIASILISVVQYFKVRKEYEKVSKNLSTNNEKKHFQWIGKMFYSIIPIMIFVTSSHFIHSNYYHVGSDAILIAVVIFYTIRIINYQCRFHAVQLTTEILETNQKESIEHMMEVTVKSRQANSSNSSADETIKEQCAQKTIRSEKKHRMIHESIEKWIINEEKAYLKNGLTIQDVSLMIGIPKRRLADFIHSHYNLSFNSWINSLRVQEVERILSSQESCMMTLSEIAYKTGFSDLSNMSSTFKKTKGMNPSEYRILVSQ